MNNKDKEKLAKLLKILGPNEVKRMVTQVNEQRRQQAEDEMLGELVESGALDEALLGAPEEEGDPDAEHFAPDELDQAEEMHEAMPTADSLAFKANLREQFHQALKKRAPWVRINPMSVLKGTIGGQQEVASGDGLYFGTPSIDGTTGSVSTYQIPRRAQVAMFRGEDEETLPVSVAFSQVAPSLPAPVVDGTVNTTAARSYGIVRYGTRGYESVFEVDIGAGTQFTLPASQVELQVALEDVVPGGGGGPISMKIAGMLSFYPIVRVTPVTRTKYVDGLAGLSSVGFTVPNLSKQVIFHRTPQTEPFRLDFKTVAGIVAYSRLYLANTFMDIPVDLSPDIVNVTVAATAGGISGRLIFYLAL